MYLSRADLYYQKLPVSMLRKLDSNELYALHQWIWQLFPGQKQRDFLFREQKIANGTRCYVLSARPPVEHNLLQVVSKPFNPCLAVGECLAFSLRANPVVIRNGKRADVLMDAKYRHMRAGFATDKIWQSQQQAAIDWLIRQSEAKGFHLSAEPMVSGYQQHVMSKPGLSKPIQFSSVDFQGVLTVVDPEQFITTLAEGMGKSKALGCGLMLIKRL